MIFPPRLRALALTAHVTASVGWTGAVLVFLGLSAVGLTSSDAATVRGAFLVMEPAARWVLLPLGAFYILAAVVAGAGAKDVL